MLQFLPALASMLLFGLAATATKKAVADVGLYKATFYSSVILLVFAALGVLAGISITLPEKLIFPYIMQVAIGSIAVMAFIKGLETGKAGILYGISNAYVLIVIGISVFFLGESINALQLGGALMVVVATAIIGLEKNGQRLEEGAPYAIITMLGWGYYYAFVKIFTIEIGPYATAIILDGSVAVVVGAYCILKARELSVPKLSKSYYVILRAMLIGADVALYNVSVSSIGAALTSGITAGAPIINSIAAYFVLGEKLSTRKYAAIALMVIGLFMIFLLG